MVRSHEVKDPATIRQVSVSDNLPMHILELRSGKSIVVGLELMYLY